MIALLTYPETLGWSKWTSSTVSNSEWFVEQVRIVSVGKRVLVLPARIKEYPKFRPPLTKLCFHALLVLRPEAPEDPEQPIPVIYLARPPPALGFFLVLPIIKVDPSIQIGATP